MSPAVRVFTKVLTFPFKYLTLKGHFSIQYIDESLLLGEVFEIFFKNIRATVALTWEPGFRIYKEILVLAST